MRSVLTLTLALSLAIAAPPGGAGAAPERTDVWTSCDHIVMFAAAPPEAVDPYVPDRFRLKDFAGSASLFLGVASCDGRSLDGGEARPTLEVKLGVEIVAPNDRVPPEREGEVNQFDFYTLMWVADNRELVAWLKREGGRRGGAKMVQVEDLLYQHDRLLGGPLHFEAPSPSPSPFVMDAVASRPVVPFFTSDAGMWIEKDGGAVLFHERPHHILLGAATATVAPEEGSLMRELFGGTDRSFGGAECDLAETTLDCAFSLGPPPTEATVTAAPEFVPCGDRCFIEEGEGP